MKINVDWDLNFEDDTRSSGFCYWVWVQHVWSTEIIYKQTNKHRFGSKFLFLFLFFKLQNGR
jgi:hypothetical protein